MRSSRLTPKEIDFKDRYFKILNSKAVQAYPYDCIGLITFKDKFGESGIGTGCLVGPDLVLTTAKNVHTRRGGDHLNLKFYCGVSGDLEEATCMEVISWRFPEEFAEN